MTKQPNTIFVDWFDVYIAKENKAAYKKWIQRQISKYSDVVERC